MDEKKNENDFTIIEKAELTDDDMLEVAGGGKKYIDCDQWCESPAVYNINSVTRVFCRFLNGYYIPYMLPCGKWDKDDILEKNR